MRILHVTYIYPPTFREADGITAAVHNASVGLARRGHEVTVHTSNALDLHSGKKREGLRYLSVNGVHMYCLNYIWRYRTFFFTPSLVSLLKRTIKDFDVVHIHDARGFQGILTYLFATKDKVPYVFQPHGSFLSPTPSSLKKRALRFLLDGIISTRIVKNSSRLIVHNEVEADQYKKHLGIQEDKIAIAPSGIDLKQYERIQPKGVFKRQFNIPEDKKIILYLGRIHKTKGIDFLVKAYAHLIQNLKYDDVMLVIAGPDDGYLSQAKLLVDHLEIADRVMFTGALSEKQKICAYVDASVVVNVEPNNVFGLVPLEAAACSTPVIVSEGNAIKYIVRQGKFGFSVKYGNIKELAETTKKMLNDNNLLRKMGQMGRKFVFENYTWANTVTKLEKIYEDAIKH